MPSCPAGQEATAESNWECTVNEADYPIYYTSDTSESACYYPYNFVDTRSHGIAASHKYYATDNYSNNMNCMFEINPGGAWRWKVTFLDIESQSTCNYDKFQIVGGDYHCNGRPDSGEWHEESGGRSFGFKTDYSVTQGGFRLVFELIEFYKLHLGDDFEIANFYKNFLNTDASNSKKPAICLSRRFPTKWRRNCSQHLAWL